MPPSRAHDGAVASRYFKCSADYIMFGETVMNTYERGDAPILSGARCTSVDQLQATQLDIIKNAVDFTPLRDREPLG